MSEVPFNPRVQYTDTPTNTVHVSNNGKAVTISLSLGLVEQMRGNRYIETLLALYAQTIEIAVRKNRKYGNSFIRKRGRLKASECVMVRLGDKWDRLQTLLDNESLDTDPSESIDDTALDGSNYFQLFRVMRLMEKLEAEAESTTTTT